MCTDCDHHTRTWKLNSKYIKSKFYKDGKLIAQSLIPKPEGKVNMVIQGQEFDKTKIQEMVNEYYGGTYTGRLSSKQPNLSNPPQTGTKEIAKNT